MIRLLAVDMDGTLLSPDGTVSKANAAALKRVQREGIQVVVCTGRSFHDASLPVKAAGIICSLICMNGAACYGPSGQLTGKKPVLPKKLERILSAAEIYGMTTDLMGECQSYTTVSREQFRRSFEQGILLPMAELDYESIEKRFAFLTREDLESVSPEVFKVSLMHRSPEVLKKVKQLLRKEGGLALSSSHATNMEITQEAAQKGIALMEYAERLHIGADEIMAIGDSGNDVSMLSLPLGLTVAMGNAMQEAKRAARYQTKSNAEDGVAWALEKLVMKAIS